MAKFKVVQISNQCKCKTNTFACLSNTNNAACIFYFKYMTNDSLGKNKQNTVNGNPQAKSTIHNCLTYRKRRYIKHNPLFGFMHGTTPKNNTPNRLWDWTKTSVFSSVALISYASLSFYVVYIHHIKSKPATDKKIGVLKYMNP